LKTLSVILGAFLATACSPPGQSVDIPFVAHWNGAPIDCGSGPVALTDLRFFVSEPRLGPDDGLAARIVTDGRWQNAEVALIDLEDGSDACENGSAETHAVLSLSVTGEPQPGFTFRLGVPQSLNHANPLIAEPPLNDSIMHWHWLSGYKFLRAGVETADDGFWMHLGSTACSGTIGNIEGCREPNRPEISIKDLVAGEDIVVIDLAELFAGIDLKDASPTRCMSAPGEKSCEPAFRALGLGAAKRQAVFRRRMQ
jgi:uncharacterized repeat protein (TIGR04052 family)